MLIAILITISILFIICLIISAIIIIKYVPNSDNIHNIKDAILEGKEVSSEKEIHLKKIRVDKIQKERKKWLRNGKIYKYVKEAVSNDKNHFNLPYGDNLWIRIEAIESIPGFKVTSSYHNDLKVTWKL